MNNVIDPSTLTRDLGGKWYGRYGRACCPACGSENKHNPALSIRQGNSGNLLLWCFRGCEFTDILDALQLRGVAASQGNFKPTNADDIRRHKAEIEAEAVKRAAQAERCWQETQPITGTLAEA